ncbi:hypothetical protein MLD38_031209 [Melastoma candidum]|uniref:Uncharacterized protein n=1 Tax=Melastoma candidum TaxID=119954 RepID=A0ACB9MPI8_9MYRT|nr:hypothetical protein MLD38_031209 [Melastoma candidum]
MKQWVSDLMLNSALRLVVGKQYCKATYPDCGKGEAETCKKSLRKLVNLLGPFVLSDVFPTFKWFDIQGYKRIMKETTNELDELAGKWLEEHKRKRLLRTKEEGEDNFIDVMLNIKEEDQFSRFDADIVIKLTCLNLLAGSVDTTMVAAVWALCLLVNHPVAMRKAQEEIDIQVGKSHQVEESDIKNLVYLQVVVKETFRLNPPVPINGFRVCREDCTLSNVYPSREVLIMVDECLVCENSAYG